MTTIDRYHRAQAGFDAVLATVPDDRFDAPSMCTEWLVRDVTGHVIWGQQLIRHLATGEEFTNRDGAPGAAKPRVLTGADPLTDWRSARAAADATLTPAALDSIVSIGGIGQVPLHVMVDILVTDHLVHTWDIAQALRLDARLDAELVPIAFEAMQTNAVRAPGMFGPELAPPPGADAQTRLLAFLGRAC